MRKSVNCQVTIDFSFTSDWLSGWFEFSGTIIGCCEISSECLLCVISIVISIIIDSSLQKHRHGSVWRCSWDWIILYSVHRILGKPLYLYVSGKGFSFRTKRTYQKNNPTIKESAVPRMSHGNEIWKADCLIMSPSSKQSVLTYRKLKYWH